MKLFAGFAVATALTVLVGIVGATRINALDRAVDSMYADAPLAISELGEARTQYATARIQGPLAALSTDAAGLAGA